MDLGTIIAVLVVVGFGVFIYKKVKASKDSAPTGTGVGGGKPADGSKQQQK